MVEKDRIFYFLYGLNTNLDEIRERILGSKPLPDLKEVFAEVKKEESKRKVMLQHTDHILNYQNSALATTRQREIFPKD